MTSVDLIADREGDLGDKPTDLDVADPRDELIASADAAKSEPTFDGAGGDAAVSDLPLARECDDDRQWSECS